MAYTWADWLHHPYRLGGPQHGDKMRNGPHVSRLATSHPPCGGWSTRGQNQEGTTCGRIGYLTPTIWGVPNKGAKSERDHTRPGCLHCPYHCPSPLPLCLCCLPSTLHRGAPCGLSLSLCVCVCVRVCLPLFSLPLPAPRGKHTYVRLPSMFCLSFRKRDIPGHRCGPHHVPALHHGCQALHPAFSFLACMVAPLHSPLLVACLPYLLLPPLHQPLPCPSHTRQALARAHEKQHHLCRHTRPFTSCAGTKPTAKTPGRSGTHQRP